MRIRAVGCVAATVAMLLAGCGGDDSAASVDSAAEQSVDEATTIVATTSAGDDQAASSTADEGGDLTSVGTPAVLPDACTLIDDATAAAAMGGAGTKSTPQPPTEVSARCEWVSGTRTISLLVRQGSSAQSDFGNVTPDFVPATTPGAEALVRLGVDEKDRDYRLVTFRAYDGQYYVAVILQGPSRDDAPATAAAESLARATLTNLHA